MEMSARKGQASLEYLLLSVVALSLLAVSVSSLIAIRDVAEVGAAAAEFARDAESLAIAANEACAMGDGNGRELEVKRETSVLSQEDEEGWLIRFSSKGNESLVRPCRCEVEDAEGFAGPVYVENEDGKIRIRGR